MASHFPSFLLKSSKPGSITNARRGARMARAFAPLPPLIPSSDWVGTGDNSSREARPTVLPVFPSPTSPRIPALPILPVQTVFLRLLSVFAANSGSGRREAHETRTTESGPPQGPWSGGSADRRRWRRHASAPCHPPFVSFTFLLAWRTKNPSGGTNPRGRPHLRPLGVRSGFSSRTSG